jgi:hypothetical protein
VLAARAHARWLRRIRTVRTDGRPAPTAGARAGAYGQAASHLRIRGRAVPFPVRCERASIRIRKGARGEARALEGARTRRRNRDLVRVVRPGPSSRWRQSGNSSSNCAERSPRRACAAAVDASGRVSPQHVGPRLDTPRFAFAGWWCAVGTTHQGADDHGDQGQASSGKVSWGSTFRFSAATAMAPSLGESFRGYILNALRNQNKSQTQP